jgi:hypothetical protein
MTNNDPDADKAGDGDTEPVKQDTVTAGPEQTEHPTGQSQAARNEENESPS